MIDKSVVDRFNKKWKENIVTGCHEWIAYITVCGYGTFKYNGKMHRAHRFSYMLHKGEIGPDLVILHSCDNPICVNPEHLTIGTHQENMKDMVKKGRGSNGNKRGMDIGSSKLTEEQVLSIYSDNRKNVIIAKEYNVSPNAISSIKRGISWDWLTNPSEPIKQERNIIRLYKRIKDRFSIFNWR
jgi:hypothetical protein